MFFFRKRPQQLLIWCDGGIGDRQEGTGLGVVIRDPQGEIVGLVKKSLPPMTNNEAEYAALVLALESVKRFKPRTLHVYMDSQNVVGQMRGRYLVRSTKLKQWHAQASRLVRRFEAVTFEYIPREHNRLADALANEALTEYRNGKRKH